MTPARRVATIWARVAKTDTCWLWQSALTTRGYAQVSINGKYVTLHRWVYEQTVGPIPDGHQLDHLCRVRHCVNPAHLEPVLPGENVRRGLRGYGARTTCRAGLHDITNPVNIYVNPNSGGRQCYPCQRLHDQRRRRASVGATS